jgi:hypothetical protein
MHFPIHLHGITLFPRVSFVDDCWRGHIDVISGTGQLAVHWCQSGYPAQAIALAFARLEMKALARALHRSCTVPTGH